MAVPRLSNTITLIGNEMLANPVVMSRFCLKKTSKISTLIEDLWRHSVLFLDWSESPYVLEIKTIQLICSVLLRVILCFFFKIVFTCYSLNQYSCLAYHSQRWGLWGSMREHQAPFPPKPLKANSTQMIKKVQFHPSNPKPFQSPSSLPKSEDDNIQAPLLSLFIFELQTLPPPF